MKIVIAPDSYKESLSALAVATAIEQGFCEIFPTAEYVKLPVADGCGFDLRMQLPLPWFSRLLRSWPFRRSAFRTG